jgi:membrane protein DedA with SNARE-associated domain
MNLHEIILAHGVAVYAVAFVWSFFEGESFVLFGGLAVAEGLLDPWLLGACVAIGSFCGDQCWFQVGRRWGPSLLRRRPRWQARIAAPLAWLERWNVGFILTFRFFYGIRNLSSFALGLSRVGQLRFTALNFLGSVIWATSFIGGGYIVGRSFATAPEHLGRDLALILLAGALLALAASALTQHRRRRRERRSQNAIRDNMADTKYR